MTWHKSSYSGSGSNCVEVGWVKSTHSAIENCVEVGWAKSSRSGETECVEAGPCTCGLVHVRDTKDREGPELVFSREVWAAFTGAIKAGQL